MHGIGLWDGTSRPQDPKKASERAKEVRLKIIKELGLCVGDIVDVYARKRGVLFPLAKEIRVIDGEGYVYLVGYKKGFAPQAICRAGDRGKLFGVEGLRAR